MFLTRSASDDDLLKGKSVAILLFYTGCQDVCPLETANLVQVQKLLGERMGKDIFFYSIAIDPWDTPKENKAYAKKFGVEPGWSFLSGKETDISLIARKLGLSRARAMRSARTATAPASWWATWTAGCGCATRPWTRVSQAASRRCVTPFGGREGGVARAGR